MDMIHEETLRTILVDSSNSFIHPDVSLDALVEIVQKHPASARDSLTQWAIQPKKMKDGVKKKDEELIIPLPFKTDLFPKASKEGSTAQAGSCRRNKKKTEKPSPFCKSKKL